MLILKSLLFTFYYLKVSYRNYMPILLLILFSYLYRIFSNLLSKKFINKGSAIAHVGLGLLFLAVSLNSILSYDKNLNLALGESIFVNESIKEFSFDDIKVLKASNHDVISVEVSLLQDGKNIFLNPQKRKYATRGQITTESSIYASILKDTYLSIGYQLENGSWTFALKINYFIKWIWFSAFLMVVGMLITIFKKKAT